MFSVEKIAPGIYDVRGNVFLTRIFVTRELSPDEYLFLHCLSNQLARQPSLIQELVAKCKQNAGNHLFDRYQHEVSLANRLAKGDHMSSNHSLTFDVVFIESFACVSSDINRCD